MIGTVLIPVLSSAVFFYLFFVFIRFFHRLSNTHRRYKHCRTFLASTVVCYDASMCGSTTDIYRPAHCYSAIVTTLAFIWLPLTEWSCVSCEVNGKARLVSHYGPDLLWYLRPLLSFWSFSRARHEFQECDERPWRLRRRPRDHASVICRMAASCCNCCHDEDDNNDDDENEVVVVRCCSTG